MFTPGWPLLSFWGTSLLKSKSMQNLCCMVLWLSLAKQHGWPATPLVQLTLGQFHLFDWNLELSLSDFSLIPYPLIQFLIPWNRSFHCDNQTLTITWVRQFITPIPMLLTSVHREVWTHVYPCPLFLYHSCPAKLKSSLFSLLLEYEKCLKKLK